MTLSHAASTSVEPSTKSLRALFWQNETYCRKNGNNIDLFLKIPALGQLKTEYLLSSLGRTYQKLGFNIVETEDRVAGALVKKVTFPLEDAAYEIYLDFLELTQNCNLYCVWNYVPYINQESFGLENYRSFCKGRSLAFETFYGRKFNVKLPAARSLASMIINFSFISSRGKKPQLTLKIPNKYQLFPIRNSMAPSRLLSHEVLLF